MIEGILGFFVAQLSYEHQGGSPPWGCCQMHCGPLGEVLAAAPGSLPALSDYELR